MTHDSFDFQIIGQSPEMQGVRELIHLVAKKEITVLLRGESGTGKELLARIIHQNSHRQSGPFIAVNCAAVPLELLESELFGHERGAFTGAIAARIGRFELAMGGTLFLDEIGDMPLPMQAKFLRVLQERVFERLGGQKTIKTDVRVIAATHRNLPMCIQEGTFREDLYYRLNVFPIELPPLRAHLSDMPELIDYLLKNISNKNAGNHKTDNLKNENKEIENQKIENKEIEGLKIENLKRENLKTEQFSEEAMNCLLEYKWPGNVRELINCLERLKVLYPNAMIGKNMLPKEIQAGSDTLERNGENGANGLHRIDGADGINGLDEDLFDPCANEQGEFDLKKHLAKVEIELIRRALRAERGVVARAAKQLGLRRTTLVEKLKKYGLVREYNPQEYNT